MIVDHRRRRGRGFPSVNLPDASIDNPLARDSRAVDADRRRVPGIDRGEREREREGANVYLAAFRKKVVYL